MVLLGELKAFFFILMQQLPETDARNFYSCDSNFLLVKKSVGERNFLIPVYCYTVPLCAIIHFEDMKIRLHLYEIWKI